jgi:hypothetical protein
MPALENNLPFQPEFTEKKALVHSFVGANPSHSLANGKCKVVKPNPHVVL